MAKSFQGPIEQLKQQGAEIDALLETFKDPGVQYDLDKAETEFEKKLRDFCIDKARHKPGDIVAIVNALYPNTASLDTLEFYEQQEAKIQGVVDKYGSLEGLDRAVEDAQKKAKDPFGATPEGDRYRLLDAALKEYDEMPERRYGADFTGDKAAGLKRGSLLQHAWRNATDPTYRHYQQIVHKLEKQGLDLDSAVAERETFYPAFARAKEELSRLFWVRRECQHAQESLAGDAKGRFLADTAYRMLNNGPCYQAVRRQAPQLLNAALNDAADLQPLAYNLYPSLSILASAAKSMVRDATEAEHEFGYVSPGPTLDASFAKVEAQISQQVARTAQYLNAVKSYIAGDAAAELPYNIPYSETHLEGVPKKYWFGGPAPKQEDAGSESGYVRKNNGNGRRSGGLSMAQKVNIINNL